MKCLIYYSHQESVSNEALSSQVCDKCIHELLKKRFKIEMQCQLNRHLCYVPSSEETQEALFLHQAPGQSAPSGKKPGPWDEAETEQSEAQGKDSALNARWKPSPSGKVSDCRQGLLGSKSSLSVRFSSQGNLWREGTRYILCSSSVPCVKPDLEVLWPCLSSKPCCELC